MNRSCISTSLTCAVALLTASSSQADIIKAQYTNSTDFSYEVAHMPDLDQRRLGLPGNGEMYCVPTSTMNMLIFLANHGYPNLAPGPGNWQSQSKWLDATNALWDMGVDYMDTSICCGTDGLGWFNGTKKWVNESPYAGQFVVTLQYAKPNQGYWPRVHHLAKAASDGALVSFAFGRFEYSFSMGILSLGERTSGHIVTLAKAEQIFGGPIVLHSRDPADDNIPAFNWLEQSQFMNRVYSPVLTHTMEVNLPLIGTWPLYVDSLEFSSSENRIRLIDAYLAISPIHGYGYTPGGHIVTKKVPFKIGGFQSPGVSTFDFGQGAIIKDFVIHPDQTSLFAIVQLPGQGPKLVEMDGMTGSASGIAEFATAKQLHFGRNRLLYVLEDDRLHEVNVDVIPERPGDPPPIQSMTLPFMADAVSFWDEDDKFAVLSSSEKKLLLYRTDPVANVFGAPPAFNFDLNVPLAGAASVAMHPPDPMKGAAAGFLTPSMWLVSEGSDSIFRINLTDGSTMEQVMLPEIKNPTNISVNDLGELFVSTPDGLFQLKKSAAGLPWMTVPPLFDVAGEKFERFYVTRSRTNLHPELHSGPGWHHEPPDSEEGVGIPDCNADLNHDGVVDVFDLIQLINMWGPCALPEQACPADLNFDQTVDVFDLIQLINNWGPCP